MMEGEFITIGATPAAALSETTYRTLARRTAQAAWLGFFVDMFDVYLPVVTLAPAIRLFEPPGGFADPQVAALVFSLTFRDLAGTTDRLAHLRLAQ